MGKKKGWLLPAVTVAGTVAAAFVAHRSRKMFDAVVRRDPNPPKRNDSERRVETQGWFQTIQKETWETDSFDGLKLAADYIPPKAPSKRLVILVHGYNGVSERMAHYARFYHETYGMHVLMPDNRGHGRSGGEYVGYGWFDRKDVLAWVEHAVSLVGDDIEIVLHGESMGASTVLLAACEDLPPQVKCAVSDGAYSELTGELKRIYESENKKVFPYLYATSLWCRIRAGYFFSEAAPIRQLYKCRLPIFFIHGGSDTFVPTEMVYELYAKAPEGRELWVVPEAKHSESYWCEPAEYVGKVRQFLNKHMTMEEE